MGRALMFSLETRESSQPSWGGRTVARWAWCHRDMETVSGTQLWVPVPSVTGDRAVGTSAREPAGCPLGRGPPPPPSVVLPPHAATLECSLSSESLWLGFFQKRGGTFSPLHHPNAPVPESPLFGRQVLGGRPPFPGGPAACGRGQPEETSASQRLSLGFLGCKMGTRFCQAQEGQPGDPLWAPEVVCPGRG